MDNSEHNHPLQPIRATEPGRTGRRHVLAQSRINATTGKVEIFMTCPKSVRCGCSGWYALDDLVRFYEGILRAEEKEKEAA